MRQLSEAKIDKEFVPVTSSVLQIASKFSDTKNLLIVLNLWVRRIDQAMVGLNHLCSMMFAASSGKKQILKEFRSYNLESSEAYSLTSGNGAWQSTGTLTGLLVWNTRHSFELWALTAWWQGLKGNYANTKSQEKNLHSFYDPALEIT